MARGMIRRFAVVVLGMASASSWAGAQVVQRDTKVTGPRGRSIERSISTVRRGNEVQRDVHIQRPGGSLDRNVTLQRAGGGGHAVAPHGARYGGPPRVIERDVIVENNYFGPPRPRFGGGFGGGFGPSFGLFLGGPVLPPPVIVVPEPVYVSPPPVYVSPPPVYAAAPPVEPQVVYQPPVRYAAPPAPETVLVDPVADAVARLQSHHDNSRRDGALTLGRLGDARAVPALVDRLGKDGEEEVRVASAWALGEIGDPRAALAVQKAALYDKRREVRDVANAAYRKLGRPPLAEQAAPAASALDPLPLDEPGIEPPRGDEPPPPPLPAGPY